MNGKSGKILSILMVAMILFLTGGTPDAAWAAGKEFFADSTAPVGKNNDKIEAENRAQNAAQMDVIKKVIAYLEVQRDVIASGIGKDDIQAVAQEATQISVLEKKPVLDGRTILISVKVKAVLEMDQVKQKLDNHKLMEQEKEKAAAAAAGLKSGSDTAKPPASAVKTADKATPESWLEKGNGFLQAKDYDRAIDAYKKAIEMNPNYADAHNYLGSALYKKTLYPEAVREFEKTISLESKDFRAYYNVALAYEKLNQVKEASNAYKKFIEYVPTFGFEEQIKYATERIHKLESQ
ncbi:MAG TPA: tetratricopeptide repeat protein [Patescibacteria group bacterium]|nr:tetratricopeptide repeat protein [Patescibacteria group bacterium]